MEIPRSLFALLVVSAAACALSARSGAQTSPPAPPGFPRFELPGHDEQAKLLSNYLWYHFRTRLGNGLTLFNQEYLTTADLWMADAVDAKRGKPIQDVHRDDLSAIRVHEDGYVDTHQHFSHAYDYGWPFPLWTQSGQSPDEVRGVTAGWHFQTKAAHGAWIYGYVMGWQRPEYFGETATKGWELHNVRSAGLVNERWRLESTGAGPTLTTPGGMAIDAFNAPYLQLRWTRTGTPPAGVRPYVEWMREGDAGFGADRRVVFDLGDTHWQHITGMCHAIIPMYTHPLWRGKITRMRLCLAPGESGVTFDIDSFFTCYDTRHTINNPIFVLAAWKAFCWTGDVAFLRQNLPRMRAAVRYQQTVMGGLAHGGIRNEWPGHDGLPGWVNKPGGGKQMHPGHGIGANYWDLLPFGWDDAYATNQYYASLLALADAEEAARKHPEWGLAGSKDAMSPAEIRRHAAQVKAEANRRFWDPVAGRFVACIDKEGHKHDYGFTFLNLDAIWYGTASDAHARAIIDWLDGKRIVASDTSTGADIYHWRFGPRATTKRNVDWYGQGWTAPESIPWGGQVQDGGAVLGFSFYDMWARLRVLGPDSAWQRLEALLAWEKDAQAAGGYRAYYKDGSRGTTLQGGGTAGGIGIDAEFYESSLVPSIVTYGFLGLDPTPDGLRFRPALPRACPEMGLDGLLYHGTRMDVHAAPNALSVTLSDAPAQPLRLLLDRGWQAGGTGEAGPVFTLSQAGTYRFTRAR